MIVLAVPKPVKLRWTFARSPDFPASHFFVLRLKILSPAKPCWVRPSGRISVLTLSGVAVENSFRDASRRKRSVQVVDSVFDEYRESRGNYFVDSFFNRQRCSRNRALCWASARVHY